MERLFVIVILLAMTCLPGSGAQRHHPKFPGLMKKEMCSNGHEEERFEVMQEALCGPPRDVFVELAPKGAHLQMSPGAAWVKRCMGLCIESGTKCTATKTRIREIPVRVLDVKTNKESCAWYTVEEHVECGCSCPLAAEGCATPRVLNERKCACECPNTRERRTCLAKKHLNMKWNRSKCACERKKT